MTEPDLGKAPLRLSDLQHKNRGGAVCPKCGCADLRAEQGPHGKARRVCRHCGRVVPGIGSRRARARGTPAAPAAEQVYSHQSRARCSECDSLDTRAVKTKYGGKLKEWQCTACGKHFDTAGIPL